MIRNNHLLTLCLSAGAISLAACGDDTPPEETTPGNIAQVAAQEGLSSLLSAATTAGLADALGGEEPLTVFAPTNAAFEALGSAAPSDPALLANVLLSHVVAGKLDSTAVTSGSPITNLAGTRMTVETAGGTLTISGAKLGSSLDIPASNGIIHVLEQVIVPPTILEAALANPDLSTLVTAVGASSSGLQSALAAAGPITVFAPVNSAFAKIQPSDLEALLADQTALDTVLSYHVVAGQVLASDLSNGQTVTTLAGQTFSVSSSASGARLTDAMGNSINITQTDIRLLNGAVHFIDSVLLPDLEEEVPGNLVEIASAAGNFTALLGAATAAGLAETLATGGPFTVFAPSDAAFTALGVDLSPVDTGVIANILLHHVIAESLDAAAVVSRESIGTLAKTSLAVNAMSSPITIGGANLSTTLDVQASNGIIHVMDQVIVPPTIVEVAVATPALSTLVAAVGAASGAVQEALSPNTLSGNSPITVFAPTNDAFAASGINLDEVEQSALDSVLAHHVVAAQAISSSLADGQVVPTLNGNLTVNVDEAGRITLTDGQGNRANVIDTLKDIRTLNGVVHVIDAVLLP